MWIKWILLSCVALSAYDICKKASVRDNAPFPVLFLSTLAAWISVTVWLVASGRFASALSVDAATVLRLAAKSLLVGSSWTATYFALRTLPITSAAPIRATGQLWTLLGAIVIYTEIPSALQALGMASVLIGSWLISRASSSEGGIFWRDRAILLAFLGTILGSCSALYDKCLLQRHALPPGTVLWWFLGGMVMLYILPALIELNRVRRGRARTPFAWRWTIPLVGVLLASSDAFYFTAISDPASRISILSVIRRMSVVFTFLVGGALFRETDLRRKAVALAAILAGVLILCLAH